MNQESKKYLRDRLKKAKREAMYATYADKTPKPAAVRRAEKTVRAWQAAAAKRRKRRLTKVARAIQSVEEAVLFGESAPALAALLKFEKMQFVD